MTDQLSLYNGALRVLRERPLADLSEANKAKRAFDADYAKCLAWCAEQGQWRHALVVTQLTVASPSDPAPIGWAYAFDLPADFARFYACSPDGSFFDPYNGFEIRGGRFYCELPSIYLKYVSDVAGVAPANFSATYVEFVETALATRSGGQITNNAELMDRLEKMGLKKALAKAKNVDAMNGPAVQMPMGSWARSRNFRTAGEG